MNQLRKIYIVVAGGNADAERHFEDTIQTRRTLQEVRQFLPNEEINNLENIYKQNDFIVWGAVPGPMNIQKWEKMEAGDIVLIYNKGHIRHVGEISAKVRSKEVAKYFWRENEAGNTWELVYFITNDQKVNIPFEKLNPIFGYKPNFTPQGLTLVNEKATENFEKVYGDVLGVIKTLDKGDYIVQAAGSPAKTDLDLEEKIEKAPTEHDEMQWRLIRLGNLAKCNVWVPKNNQNKHYEGNIFSEFVLPEFHESIDVPRSIQDIDVVWKMGPYSIKSAFEIEHSTSVYSGILRLSDLRAETPNSVYPLFIVASTDRKNKVFNELKRPTFSGPCLRLHEVIRFLDYKKIREIDEEYKSKTEFDPSIIISAGEAV